MQYPAIGDYGVIGDCRTAALISREGSLDWLCFPRFDSPSVFGALLDANKGGRFAVRPVGGFETQRRYLDYTNILETIFATDTGRVRLIDLTPVASEEEKCCELWPDHEVLRALECLEGEIEMEVLFDPRPAYGAIVPRPADRGRLGFCFEAGSSAFLLRSDIPLHPAVGRPGLEGSARLRRGERAYLLLSFAQGGPAIFSSLGDVAEAKIARSIRWWRQWSSRCRYEGPFERDVLRSALTLKLMTYAPSGAVVAAPTTSLPEKIGGSRNWDYRYCWLRDAAMMLRALLDLGYAVEGEAFLAWLLHATRLTQPQLQILYDVYGRTRLPEQELPHLEGYAGSRPVRIGNEAAQQLQLDTYGEVIDAAYTFASRGGRLDRQTARVLVGLGRTVSKMWQEPDEGIWEIRSGRRHHTYSKVMCWVALDRLLKLHEGGLLSAPAGLFASAREAIRHQIETRGYNPRLESYVSVLDGDEVDASLLLLGLYGYSDLNSSRMRHTCARVQERLGRNGLLYRYLGEDDGLPPGEGAFGICSFWGVECRARHGDLDEAADMLEKLCSYGNDLGLFAEEIDPETGAALGNFPQAFTHVGLINAALTLAKYSGRVPQPEIDP